MCVSLAFFLPFLRGLGMLPPLLFRLPLVLLRRRASFWLVVGEERVVMLRGEGGRKGAEAVWRMGLLTCGLQSWCVEIGRQGTYGSCGCRGRALRRGGREKERQGGERKETRVCM